MRIGPYLHLVRTSFLKLMAYRMRYVTGIATYTIFVGVQYFIWRAVYASRAEQGGDEIGGLGLDALVTYIAVGYIARAAYYNNCDAEIAERFQSGEVVMDLLRPLDFHGNYLAQAVGETLFRLVFFALPMSLVIVPLFGVQPPTGDGWWQFPLLFVIAFIINAELSLLAGTVTFYLEDSTGLMSLKRNIVMVASGLMVPLHFLAAVTGEAFIEVLVRLPFALIGYYPILAYVGGLGAAGTPTLGEIGLLAIGWMVAMRVLNLTLWRAARRRLEVQGG